MSGGAFSWKPADQLPARSSVAWLWDQYIAAGTLCFLGGPAGAGKSSLVAALEVAVAAGVPFLDAQTQQGEVWHVDFDTDERLQGPWYRRVAAGLGVGERALQRIRYLTPSNPATGLGLAELNELEEAVRVGGPRLVVIDSWAAAFFYLDSRKSEHIAELAHHLRRLAALGPSVLIIDHTPKPMPGLTMPERGIAGSFYKLGGARSAFLVQRVAPKLTGGVDMLRWDCLKNNLAPLSEPAGIIRHFERDSLRFELTELPAEEADRAPALTRAVRAIREALHDGPLLRPELVRRVAERANVSERSITEALRRMRAAGEVEVRESGGRGNPAQYVLRFALNQENPDSHRNDLAQTPLRQMLALNQENLDSHRNDLAQNSLRQIEGVALNPAEGEDDIAWLD